MPTMTANSSQQQFLPPAEPALQRICPGGTTLTDAAVVRPPPTLDSNVAALLVGRGVTGEAASISLLRWAKDVVSKTDVPFLLQLPYTKHEVLYHVMTECYGLVPRVYTTMDKLDCAEEYVVLICLKLILYPKRLYYCFQLSRTQGLRFALAHHRFMTDNMIEALSGRGRERCATPRENVWPREKQFPAKNLYPTDC